MFFHSHVFKELLARLRGADEVLVVNAFADAEPLAELLAACQQRSDGIVKILIRNPSEPSPSRSTYDALAKAHARGLPASVLIRVARGDLHLHAKCWLFRSGQRCEAFLGSLNLTESSRSTSCEAGAWLEGGPSAFTDFAGTRDGHWKAAKELSQFLCDNPLPPPETKPLGSWRSLVFVQKVLDLARRLGSWLRPRQRRSGESAGKERGGKETESAMQVSSTQGERSLRPVVESEEGRADSRSDEETRRRRAVDDDADEPAEDIDLDAEEDAESKIECAENSLLPHDFQDEAIGRIIRNGSDALRKDSELVRDLLVLPTGAGKTVVAACAAKSFLEHEQRILWVTHRVELLVQAYQTFKKAGIPSGAMAFWTGRRKEDAAYSGNARVVFFSVSCWDRPRGPFDVVMIDEAHHAVTDSYRELLSSLRRGRTRYALLLTATPKRSDGRGLHQAGPERKGRTHFDRVVYRKSFVDLAPDHLAVPKFDWLEWPTDRRARTYKFQNGDFAAETLNELAGDKERNKLIVERITDRAGKDKMLLFAVNADQVRKLQRQLVQAGVPAKSVVSDTNPSIRNDNIEWFKSTPGAALANCFIYLEGMDVPDLDRVVIARPTFSQSRYLQMLGRGARKGEDGSKTTFKVTDVLDNFIGQQEVARPWMVLFPDEWEKWGKHNWPFQDHRKLLGHELDKKVHAN